MLRRQHRGGEGGDVGAAAAAAAARDDYGHGGGIGCPSAGEDHYAGKNGATEKYTRAGVYKN